LNKIERESELGFVESSEKKSQLFMQEEIILSLPGAVDYIVGGVVLGI